MKRMSLLLKPASLARLCLLVLLVGLSGCEGWTPVSKEATESDPSRFRRALVAEQARLVRFVVGYVRRQEAIRLGKRLDRVEVDRLFEEALQAYERAYGVQGVVVGYRRAQAALRGPRSGIGLQAWWDSLGLEAEQQAWMARLWEEFRTSHTVKELDVRLSRYEQEVVEALGTGRSEVLLWNAAVLYGMTMLAFGQEDWAEDLRAMLKTLQGEVRRGSLTQEIRRSLLMRPVLQGISCNPDAAPQFGDYWSFAGLTGAVMTGCVSGIGYLGPAVYIHPVEMGAACATFGGVFAGAYMLMAYGDYRGDMIQWCRGNREPCRNNDRYHSICNEFHTK